MLCRWAKPLGKAFITRGSSSFQVKANTLSDVTLTLYKVHARGAVCVAAFRGHVTRARPAEGQEKDLYLKPEWDSSRAPTSHWDRRATIATSLSKSVRSRGGKGHVLAPPPPGSGYGRRVTGDGLVGDACVPGPFGRLRSPGTMPTRAASTAAAKQREAGDEQHKGDEQALKDASSPPEKDPDRPEPSPEGEKPNKTQQLKKVFREYGAVGVSFHICMSLMSLGMFYLLVSSGIDMGALLCKLGFSETVVKSKMAAGTSTFVLAYAVHKLFAPVRISITLVSVPLIVRHFRKIGLFKAPPKAP
ncbi:protein FAM210B, mitochondrial [Eucyclogobius newberryi]|uniref:protein FAM210B, mitochondrial n=1 Tax=Eucyclogobius newberryi TaxID=166745 RepID=UPI003B5D02E6